MWLIHEEKKSAWPYAIQSPKEQEKSKADDTRLEPKSSLL